jgi:hypothetical protein
MPSGSDAAAIDNELLDPRIEYHDDRRWPEARSTFGASALLERFVEVLEVLGKNAHVEVEELFDCEDDWVLMTFRFSGEARASGIRHDYRWGFLCRVVMGRSTTSRRISIRKRPSKPAGVGSRRCLRRTSSWCAVPSMHSVATAGTL